MNEDEDDDLRRSVDLLQQLGLKEYEARCLVALTRLPRGTAKEISEVSQVPRTRVYDAIRVLESKGLVEVQHTSPQQFRAVSVAEAAETLHAEYADRTDALRDALGGVEPVSADDDGTSQEVWSLSGDDAVAARCIGMIADAAEEVVLVLADVGLLDDDLADALEAASERGVNVVVGTATQAARGSVAARLPGAVTFVSGLGWLDDSDEAVDVGRLLLADRAAIIASAIHADGAERAEHAVYGTGITNGLVVVVRRLLAMGLLGDDDPGSA